MNTDIAQLCRVLRTVLNAAQAGKMSKDSYAMCEAILSALEEKYRAGTAALAEASSLTEK